MRTVILFGLIAIADAINKNWHESDMVVTAYAILILASIVMDLVEFVNKLLHK